MNELTFETKCFNLKYTLECGQCFRWNKVDDSYVGIIFDRVIKIKQEENKLYVKSNIMDNLEDIVKKYFDLYEDYEIIEKNISKIDNNINKAVKNTTGLRILNQDFFETLISYIISANNNIPRISKSIKDISFKYGKKIIFENEDYYLFPTIEELKNVNEEEFRKCGVGFRDKYIVNTIKIILENKIDILKFENLDTQTLRNYIMTFQGVGPKVADCILLFSCNRKEVFPVDVWVERVMNLLYFKDVKKNMSKKEILEYANEKFGKYSGIIQEHLFCNIREKFI